MSDIKRIRGELEVSGERTKWKVEVYYDVEGTERTLYEMLKVEPEWAVSRIKAGERAVKNNERLEKALNKIRALDHGDCMCDQCKPYYECAEIARETLAQMEKEE